MDTFGYFFAGFGILILLLMLFPGRWLWSKYVELSKLRPGEVILFTEDRVWATYEVTKCRLRAGDFSWGCRRVKVTVTNERILEHWGTHTLPFGADTPVGIINYKTREKQPSFIRYFDASYFLHFDDDKLSFQTDRDGREYVELSDNEFGIRKRFFFRNIEEVKAIFGVAAPSH